ncbi:alpha/beta hydrolase family protein [Streptomyces sp. KLOTTS4A1]|uniref:alpha/beta hydrolase family protein n=1 Tax=Streptomyces sp. KLOTTS4A1 TaxID=3390996 RepID=UPI0039F62634
MGHRPSPVRRFRRRFAVLAATTATFAGVLAMNPGAATAATTSAASASTTYPVKSVSVPDSAAPGFGGGTIYYPDGDGPFAAVAMSPGFLGNQGNLAWLGKELASQGFVAFSIDTNTIFDQPASRGDQLLAALDHLTEKSTVRDLVDAGRLGVIGHSMGGGGSLEAVKTRPSLKAAIPLTPWNMDKSWPEVTTPTLVIGAENDWIAPVASHAEPFYRNTPGTLDKAYLELNGAGHMAPTSGNSTIAKYGTAWLKLFLNGDESAAATLCPGPANSGAIEEYRSTCPF